MEPGIRFWRLRHILEGLVTGSLVGAFAVAMIKGGGYIEAGAVALGFTILGSMIVWVAARLTP